MILVRLGYEVIMKKFSASEFCLDISITIITVGWVILKVSIRYSGYYQAWVLQKLQQNLTQVLFHRISKSVAMGMCCEVMENMSWGNFYVHVCGWLWVEGRKERNNRWIVWIVWMMLWIKATTETHHHTTTTTEINAR